MDRAELRRHPVIDLVSDDEDDFGLDPIGDDLFAAPYPGANDDLNNFFDLDAPYDPDRDADAIDLTGFEDIPDVDVPPGPNAGIDPIILDHDADLTDGEKVTEAACLQMVLDVLPDISVEHVLSLIQEQTQDNTRTLADCERIITRLLDGGTYPKEQEASSRKRKREGSLSDIELGEGNTDLPGYKIDAVELLKDEFLSVPVRHIENVLQQHKSFFKAYMVIEEQLRNYRTVAKDFTKIGRARIGRGMKFILAERGSQVPKELAAVRRKTEQDAVKRQKAEEAKQAEEENLRQAQLMGDMGECQCCFDDFPLNRMASCSGHTAHFFCLSCAKKYVETEMGSGRCRPTCFADPDCGGLFTRTQLQQFLGDASFERLEHLQQQQELAEAGLDLDECPFCDFKMNCPPVEEDKEFRCLNPKCRKTSCRLCQKETHVPKSCDEAKKDDQITIRHVVEEAMSAALIRHCNRCKNPFIKEYGCNKMSCSKCGNLQCYVCSKDVQNYNHFSDGQGVGGSRCPLHDNVEDRHEKEVKKAADEAMAKVRAENPEISEADLLVQVSDRVKKAETDRRGQAQVAHAGFGFRMAPGGILARVQANIPVPPPPIMAQPAQYVPLHQPLRILPAQHILQPHPYPYPQGFAPPPYQDPNDFLNDILAPGMYEPQPFGIRDLFGAIPQAPGRLGQAMFGQFGGLQQAPVAPAPPPPPPPPAPQNPAAPRAELFRRHPHMPPVPRVPQRR